MARTKDRMLFKDRHYKRKDVITAFLFLLPAFLIFIVFKYIPLIDNFRFSLTSWNLFTEPRYVGFSNFKAIFASDTFWKILKNTLFYTFWSTVISIFLGFVMASVLFKRKGTGSKILKTLFFIPNITTASAVAILWVWIFDPDFGLSGQLFSLFGMESPRWLITPGYAMWIVISLTVWRSVGYIMLIYSSGLASINSEIYEAADIDGATSMQKTTKITLPLLAPTTYFLITTTFIQAMQVFDIVSVMTTGGPYDSTNVLNLYIYQMAFARGRAGYAAALSVILFFILLICTIIQRKVSNMRGGDYA